MIGGSELEGACISCVEPITQFLKFLNHFPFDFFILVGIPLTSPAWAGEIFISFLLGLYFHPGTALAGVL